MTAPSEAIHPELDARLRARFDDPATLSVYADWLEERGDPRGTLMRMQSHPPIEGGPTDGAFIDRHWERWFEVPPSPPLLWCGLKWKSGFVREATLFREAAIGRSRLWALPVMRFLEELSLLEGAGPRALAGLTQLPCLQALEALSLQPGHLAVLAGQRLLALEALTLELPRGLSDDDLTGLQQVELPALRRLRCDFQPVEDSAVAGAVVRALSQWPQVAMRLEVNEEATVAELAPLLASFRAEHVTLVMPTALAVAWRDRLLAARPTVQLRLLLANEHAEWEMKTSATSWFLSEQGEAEDEKNAEVRWAAGREVAWPLPVDPDDVAVCGACASQRVHCHYRRDRIRPDEDIAETDIEARCDDCGQFSRYTRLWSSGAGYQLEGDWYESLGDAHGDGAG